MATTTTTTTTTAAAESGAVSTVTTTVCTPGPSPSNAPEIDPNSPLVVYNWPMMGRCGAQFLMLEHAGIEYKHVGLDLEQDFNELLGLCTTFGGKTGNFALPIIVDNGMILSQSYAQCIYIGRKAGLEAGSYCQFKAMQMLADIDDWLLNNFKPGIPTLTSTEALKTFLEGSDGQPARFANFASAIEFNIEGDFTFGAEPSCVDFFLVRMPTPAGARWCD